MKVHGTRSPSSRWRAVAWWADGMIVSVPCGVLLVARLWGERPVAVVTGALVWALAYGLMRRESRTQFRRGWQLGFRAGVLGAAEAAAGRTPTIVAQGIVDGDATPEPWWDSPSSTTELSL